MIELGTRVKQGLRYERAPQGSQTRSLNRDLGMTKRAAASLTFAGANVSGSNGTFAGFALNDPVLVEGTNLNNGYFTIAAIDGANHAFLTLDPRPKAEGPVAGVVRTP